MPSWTATGGMMDLGTPGGARSEAYAVHNGQVVGLAEPASGESHAFSWTATGGMVDLGTLGGTRSEASAVHNGQVVGLADTAASAQHALLWMHVGDCNSDGHVATDELVTGVGIALGTGALANCRVFDTVPDGKVTIDELVQAIEGAG